MIRVLVGPTASGKTRLALEVAPSLHAEVLSADSRQVYRGMDVGTAKPTAEERARVPHHLVDLVEPSERYDVSRYQRDAEAMVSALARREVTPLVVGGTGLYVRALIDGLSLRDLPHDPDLRSRLEAEASRDGGASLHRRLAELDPIAATKAHPNNVRRVIRYLEATLLAGAPASALWAAGPRREARLVGLLPDRAALDRAIDARVAEMVERGVLEETRSLLARGFDERLSALSGHGYPHWVAHVRDRLPLDEAIVRTRRDTRAYARRQLTWFRRDPRIRWFDPDRDWHAARSVLVA